VQSRWRTFGSELGGGPSSSRAAELAYAARRRTSKNRGLAPKTRTRILGVLRSSPPSARKTTAPPLGAFGRNAYLPARAGRLRLLAAITQGAVLLARRSASLRRRLRGPRLQTMRRMVKCCVVFPASAAVFSTGPASVSGRWNHVHFGSTSPVTR